MLDKPFITAKKHNALSIESAEKHLKIATVCMSEKTLKRKERKLMENKEAVVAQTTDTTQQAEPKAQEPEKANEPNLVEMQATIEKLQSENEKLKKAQSNASSDAADWKKKYRASLDEAARIEEEKAERLTAMENQLAEYRERDRVNSYSSRLQAAGYDAITAQKMAINLPDGVSDEFFEEQKAFLDNLKQTAKTQALNNQPNLSAGMPPASGADASSEEDKQMRKWFGL